MKQGNVWAEDDPGHVLDEDQVRRVKDWKAVVAFVKELERIVKAEENRWSVIAYMSFEFSLIVSKGKMSRNQRLNLQLRSEKGFRPLSAFDIC